MIKPAGPGSVGGVACWAVRSRSSAIGCLIQRTLPRGSVRASAVSVASSTAASTSALIVLSVLISDASFGRVVVASATVRERVDDESPSAQPLQAMSAAHHLRRQVFQLPGCGPVFRCRDHILGCAA